MAAKTKAKAAEVEEDDVELDELDEDVEESDNGSSKASEVTFGVSDLATHLSKKTGRKITPRDLRTLIRKMAREDKPRVDREITAGNRTRYDWPNGLKDPEVKRIVAAVEGGELEAGKKEALENLKKRKAEKKAAGKKGKKSKAKVEDDEDLDDEDDDE